MEDTPKKISDMGAMKALGVGCSVSFPVAKLCTIRTNASTINTLRGRRSLSTSLSPDKTQVTVTRNS